MEGFGRRKRRRHRRVQPMRPPAASRPRRGRYSRPCPHGPRAAARARPEKPVTTLTSRCWARPRAARSIRASVSSSSKPVAGLHLDGRDAFGQQGIQPRQRRCHQQGLARHPRRPDGREDAPAQGGDLGIGRTVEPALELMGAVAREDEMGVAVDQPGRDPSAVEPDPLGGIGIARQLILRSGEGDLPSCPRWHRADHAQVRSGRVECGSWASSHSRSKRMRDAFPDGLPLHTYARGG